MKPGNQAIVTIRPYGELIEDTDEPSFAIFTDDGRLVRVFDSQEAAEAYAASQAIDDIIEMSDANAVP